MIKISVENVEAMDAKVLLRVGGLFSVIANYVHSLEMEQADNSPKASKPQDMSAKKYVESLEVPPPVLEEVDPTHTPAAAPFIPPALEPWPFPEPNTAGIDVDSDGMPWDGRIHASSRAKIAGGQWRMKRNVEPDVLTTVTGELRQMLTGVTQTAPAPPTASIVPPAPFVPSVVPSVPQAPIIPTVSVGAAVGASPSSATPPNAFFSLMKGITAGYAAKTLTQDMITAAVTSVGVPSLPMLVQRPELVPGVASALGITL